MELEQIIVVVLILIIVYMLLQMPQQQRADNVVYLQSPYMGYGFGQGPIWRGPRPGRRNRWRRRFWF